MYIEERTKICFLWAFGSVPVGSEDVLLNNLSVPPPSAKNGLTLTLFISKLSHLIERLFTSSNKLIFVGDFNIPMDDLSNPQTILFNWILTTFSLRQHVYGPTHLYGHTLDLVITRQMDDEYIFSTQTYSDTLSDHSYVISELRFPSPRLPKINIWGRSSLLILMTFNMILSWSLLNLKVIMLIF